MDITDLVLLPDKNQFVTTSKDTTVKVWVPPRTWVTKDLLRRVKDAYRESGEVSLEISDAPSLTKGVGSNKTESPEPSPLKVEQTTSSTLENKPADASKQNTTQPVINPTPVKPSSDPTKPAEPHKDEQVKPATKPTPTTTTADPHPSNPAKDAHPKPQLPQLVDAAPTPNPPTLPETPREDEIITIPDDLPEIVGDSSFTMLPEDEEEDFDLIGPADAPDNTRRITSFHPLPPELWAKMPDAINK